MVAVRLRSTSYARRDASVCRPRSRPGTWWPSWRRPARFRAMSSCAGSPGCGSAIGCGSAPGSSRERRTSRAATPAAPSELRARAARSRGEGHRRRPRRLRRDAHRSMPCPGTSSRSAPSGSSVSATSRRCTRWHGARGGVGARPERDGARARRDPGDPSVAGSPCVERPSAPRSWRRSARPASRARPRRRRRRQPVARARHGGRGSAASSPRGGPRARGRHRGALPRRPDAHVAAARRPSRARLGHRLRRVRPVHTRDPTGGRSKRCSRSERGTSACPVLAGAPFGHGARNEAFVLGSRARIEGDCGAASSPATDAGSAEGPSASASGPRASLRVGRLGRRAFVLGVDHLGEIVGDDDLLLELLAVRASPRRRARASRHRILARVGQQGRWLGQLRRPRERRVEEVEGGSLARPEQLVGADAGREGLLDRGQVAARRRAASRGPSPAASRARSS